MLSFVEFISERTADPVELAQRASRRFGKKTSYGKWDKVERGGHIPLSNFDSRKSGGAAMKLDRVHDELGSHFDKAHTQKKMNISDLSATQSHVKTSDVEKLRSKVADKSPQHVHVVTHRGIHYIADGHHAVMAAKLRGEKQIQVNHIDLDKYK
jgi:hypothetical protein